MNEDQTTQPPKQPVQPPAPEAPKPEPVDDATQDNGNNQYKGLVIVGYILPFLFFLPLITEAKNNKFARYHANQQLNLLLFWVIGEVAASVLTVIVIGVLLYPLVMIAGVIFMILGVINAANGVEKPLPVIGKFELLK